MEFYISLALSVLLQVLRDRNQAKRFYPVIAKVLAKAEVLALGDPALQAEIDHQRKKEGLG